MNNLVKNIFFELCAFGRLFYLEHEMFHDLTNYISWTKKMSLREHCYIIQKYL